MAFLSIIRRWALREHLSIREIARRTGLSRNTIRKYLRTGAVEPKFTVPDRPSKLDPYALKLVGWLKTEAGKSRKQRRTAKHLHEDLVKLGYTGSYGRVAAFARAWRADRQREQQTTGRGTFVPLVFQPGESFQFDWSEDWAVLGGEPSKLQVAHIKLSHSRAFLLRAYPLQTHDLSHRARTDGAAMASMFDAHWHAFRVFGGVPGRGIYDNMKTAVDRVGRGKERQVNARFLAMTSHYVYAPEFCNPAAGWDRAIVRHWSEDNGEGASREERSGFPTPPVATCAELSRSGPNFPDLAALNAWLEHRCVDLWRDIPHRVQPGTIAGVWAGEQVALMALPPAFDGFVEQSKRVSPTCLISFDRNRYSVPSCGLTRPHQGPRSLRTFCEPSRQPADISRTECSGG